MFGFGVKFKYTLDPETVESKLPRIPLDSTIPYSVIYESVSLFVITISDI